MYEEERPVMNIRELGFRSGEIIDRFFYVSNLNMNGLFRIDLESGDLSFVGFFKDNPMNMQEMHYGSLLYKDWIVFTPRNAKGIDLYNWRTGEFRCIHFNDGNGYWVNGILCGNIVWFIPVDSSNHIFSLNLNTFSVRVCQRPADCMRDEHIMGRMYRTAYLDGKIYAAIYKTRYVFCFCIDTNEMEVIDTGVDDLCVIDAGKNGLWLLIEHGKKICHWKLKSEEKKFFQCLIEPPTKENERLASFILETGNNIYMFPGRMTTSVMRFNRNREVFEAAFTYPKDWIWHNLNSNYFWGSVSYNGKHFVYPFNTDYIIAVDDEETEFIKIKQIDTAEDREVFDSYFASIMEADIINEFQVPLSDFLSIFERSSKKKLHNHIVDVGNQIYRMLLEQ